MTMSPTCLKLGPQRTRQAKQSRPSRHAKTLKKLLQQPQKGNSSNDPKLHLTLGDEPPEGRFLEAFATCAFDCERHQPWIARDGLCLRPSASCDVGLTP